MRYIKTGLAITTFAFILAACEPVETAANTYGIWANKSSAKTAYPNLKPQQAQVRYANDKMREILKALPNDAERQLAAAHFYYGFQHTNSRAVASYCAEVGLDVSRYASIFKSMHTKEEASARAILDAHGISEEDVWQAKKKRAIAAAKYGLMSAGGNSGSYTICSDMRKNPSRYLISNTFGVIFPYAMRVMTKPVQTASNTL